MSQEFNNTVLNLAKQKEFYTCEYMSNFEKFKKNCLVKKGFTIIIFLLLYQFISVKRVRI